MLSRLICTLIFLSSLCNAGQKVKMNGRCNSVIQMGIMNNLVTTGHLGDHFPDLPKASVDFLAADFERTKAITELAIKSGKPAPTSLLTQMVERTEITQPTKGKHIPVKGESDLLKSSDRATKKMAMEEERTAHTLGDMGYEVKFNDGKVINRERMIKEGLDPKRSPDLEVNGKIFDIYTSQSVDPAAAAQGVIDKIAKGQTHRVVVNVSESYATPEKMAELSKELRRRNPDGLHEVIAIQKRNGVPELIRVFP